MSDLSRHSDASARAAAPARRRTGTSSVPGAGTAPGTGHEQFGVSCEGWRSTEWLSAWLGLSTGVSAPFLAFRFLVLEAKPAVLEGPYSIPT